MPMKNPPHPGGLVLRQCIEPLRAHHHRRRCRLGARAPRCPKLVNGKRVISPEMAVRLSQVFGGGADSWLTQQAQYDLAQLPTSHIKLRRLIPA